MQISMRTGVVSYRANHLEARRGTMVARARFVNLGAWLQVSRPEGLAMAKVPYRDNVQAENDLARDHYRCRALRPA